MPDLLQTIREFIARIAKRLFGFGRDREDRSDLEQTALVIALEIEQEQLRPIDLARPGDQEQLETRLKREWRRWDKGRRGASLDYKKAGRDGDELAALVEVIPGPPNSDPLLAILSESAERDRSVIPPELWVLRDRSYSEFSAYLTFLLHVDLNLDSAAGFLAVSGRTLAGRIRRSHERVMVQPSPFDGIAVIDMNFFPKAGLPRPPKLPSVVSFPQTQLPL